MNPGEKQFVKSLLVSASAFARASPFSVNHAIARTSPCRARRGKGE